MREEKNVHNGERNGENRRIIPPQREVLHNGEINVRHPFHCWGEEEYLTDQHPFHCWWCIPDPWLDPRVNVINVRTEDVRKCCTSEYQESENGG